MKEALIIVRGPIGVRKTSVSRELHAIMPENSSIVDPDLIKRMIDPTKSSEWRRVIAHNSAAYILEQLLRVPRSGIVETHTKFPVEVDRYARIAKESGAPLVNVLLTAPLGVCLERTRNRVVSGIGYDIDEKMVENFYCNLEPHSNDLVYDTSLDSADEIAHNIYLNLT